LIDARFPLATIAKQPEPIEHTAKILVRAAGGSRAHPLADRRDVEGGMQDTGADVGHWVLGVKRDAEIRRHGRQCRRYAGRPTSLAPACDVGLLTSPSTRSRGQAGVRPDLHDGLVRRSPFVARLGDQIDRLSKMGDDQGRFADRHTDKRR
jgi:hypothetical protein